MAKRKNRKILNNNLTATTKASSSTKTSTKSTATVKTILILVLVALISFLAGILTPPFLLSLRVVNEAPIVQDAKPILYSNNDEDLTTENNENDNDEFNDDDDDIDDDDNNDNYDDDDDDNYDDDDDDDDDESFDDYDDGEVYDDDNDEIYDDDDDDESYDDDIMDDDEEDSMDDDDDSPITKTMIQQQEKIVSAEEDLTEVDSEIIQTVPCTKENLLQFIHELPVDGMHLLCFNAKGTNLTIYRKMMESVPYTTQISLPVQQSKRGYTFWFIRQRIIEVLRLDVSARHKKRQPWAMYTSRGELVVHAKQNTTFNSSQENVFITTLLSEGMFVLFEGGAWLWPGVKEGFIRQADLNYQNKQKQVTMETLSLRPLVVSIQNFITEEEHAHIQKKAGPHVKYSDVTLMDKDKGKPAKEWRTSQSTFLTATDGSILEELEYKTASLTRIPRTHQEHLQVLLYKTHGKYSAHHDWFNPKLYVNDKSTLNLIRNGERNRMATVFMYLSDVTKGGHTIFPRANGLPAPYNMDDCTKGLKVKPEKGKVILFYNLKANGDGDELSLHGACPVGEGGGEKWAANKWIWNAPMGFIR